MLWQFYSVKTILGSSFDGLAIELLLAVPCICLTIPSGLQKWFLSVLLMMWNYIFARWNGQYRNSIVILYCCFKAVVIILPRLGTLATKLWYECYHALVRIVSISFLKIKIVGMWSDSFAPICEYYVLNVIKISRKALY